MQGAGEMAQEVMALAAQPDDVRTHTMEGENSLLQGVLWAPPAHSGACEYKQVINVKEYKAPTPPGFYDRLRNDFQIKIPAAVPRASV